MPINKSAYRRYKIIDRMVRDSLKRYPTMAELISECNERLGIDTTVNTIQKDLEHMRELPPDGFGAPIYYNRTHRGYAYSDPDYKLTDISLNDTDIEAIKEFVDFIAHVGGAGMSEKFNHAIEKILSTALEEFPEKGQNGKNGKSGQSLPVLQTMSPPPSRGYEHVDLFYKACRNKLPVSFVHYSYKKRKFSHITLHPFLIKEFEHKWYILGYSERHQEVRTFGLDRVFDPLLLRKTFVAVDRKIVASTIADYYGVFPIPEQPKQKIKIMVSTLATNYFQAYPIHKSQDIQKEPDGHAVISLELVPTLELTRLFLAQGHHVQVLEPEWLIEFTENLK
jgi:predicted DNA-binding transcriptional regulator YafY